MLPDDDHIAKMKAYYDARAPWHDSYMSYVSREQMHERSSTILNYIDPLNKGKRVLEIACGTGNWTQLLAEYAKEVLAVDSSPQSLNIAQTKLTGQTNIRLELADAYQLGSLAGKFDAAFAADWYSHIPKSCIPEFLRGLQEKLVSGAAVIVVDMTKNHLRGLYEQEFSHYDAEGNRISRRKLPDGSIHEVIKNFPSEEDVLREVGPFGFDIQYVPLPAVER